ncbi:MAG: hypothetical protein V4616_05620 [Bacteroidota bacterium]
MEENFGIRAMEIARRFYLNPTHEGSIEFTKGGMIRLRHHNLGTISGIITGFEQGSEGNGHLFHVNLADGDHFKCSLNNYGFYSVEGGEDHLGLLLLTTSTEREETDFSTVRVQQTYPDHGVFVTLDLSLEEVIESLKESGQMDYSWIIDREAVKSLFQLHDIVMVQFTMTNPETGEFDADLYCPGYKLELNYRHNTQDLQVNVVVLNDAVHWPGF